MKHRIPDQAEKLRQIAKQESLHGPGAAGLGLSTLDHPGNSRPAPAAPDKTPPPVPEFPEIAALPDSESLTPAQSAAGLDPLPAPSAPVEKPLLPVTATADRNFEDAPVDAPKSPVDEPLPSAPIATPSPSSTATASPGTTPPETAAPPVEPEILPVPETEIPEEPATDASTPGGPPGAGRCHRRMLTQDHTRVIAVSGGKGGVGKSNVACNLALAMAKMKKRVLLLDADLSLANVDVLLGITPRLNLSHMISGEKTLEEIMVEGPEGIRIIPGGSGLEEMTNLSPREMDRLFDAFADIDPAPDIFLIDTAAGIHPNVLQFLTAADQTIVVTTPEPTAYTDAYALIKTLHKHDPQKEIGVLINMAQTNAEAAEVIRLMLHMCRQFLQVSFNNLGFIPRDPEVLKSVRHQKPFLLHSPACPASLAVRNIAATILQISVSGRRPRGLRQFFRNLFSYSTAPAPAAEAQ
ncbi:MAG: P-loop NTPase [bacterium]